MFLKGKPLNFGRCSLLRNVSADQLALFVVCKPRVWFNYSATKLAFSIGVIEEVRKQINKHANR